MGHFRDKCPEPVESSDEELLARAMQRATEIPNQRRHGQKTMNGSNSEGAVANVSSKI
jgi:alpha-glucosidase (family GH31 glycosyl hydrolase)